MNEKESKNHLISVAKNLQQLHYKLLDGTSFDLIPRNSLSKFTVILRSYLPEKEAIPLSQKIIQNDSDLIYRILVISCVVDGKLLHSPVIRVKKDSQCLFYDNIGREYYDWNDYLCHNKLPEGLMIYPMNGTYTEEKGEVQIEIKKTPSAGLPSKVGKFLYTSAEVVNLIALVLPLFSFSKPYASHISIASGISNGYKVGYDSYQLIDRYKHGQSFLDEDALMHWSHIGSSFLCFALTYHRSFYVNPSPKTDLGNMIHICSILIKERSDIPGACQVIKGKFLSMYMLDFNTDLVQKLKVMLGRYELEPILRNLQLYLSQKSSVLRKILTVNDRALGKVLQDITVCENINSIHITINEVAMKMEHGILSKVMEEAKSWHLNNLSDNQLQFRVSSICRYGQRAYETLEELCQQHGVGRLEDILINNKPIFKNISGKRAELEELVISASKKFPQLLSYAVQYAYLNDPVDWDKFKPYFIDKLHADCASFIGSRPTMPWIDIRTLDEVSRCNSDYGIFFVRPRNQSTVVSPQDLINLGKKFLGILSLSPEDILVAELESRCTVLISRRKEKVLFIGPKVGNEVNSLKGCYPVFAKSFL